jgi:hypothetical protein
MRFVALRRAVVATAAISLFAIPSVYAETLVADGDVVSSDVQGTIDLGSAEPGQDIAVDVNFVLQCSGTSHIDAGQSVRLTPGARTIPPGGGFSIGSMTFAPGAGWPADGEPCPAGLPPTVGGPAHLIVTAPLALGTNYRYSFTWNRSLLPSTTGDSGVFEGPSTTVVFLLDVANNTPPELHLPADVTIEGNTTSGAIAAYSVSASDAEDGAPPTPTCAPVVGSVLPLGTTSVDCDVTDSGGMTASGAFDITVVDTTPPSLAGVPASAAATTSNPAGAAVAYPAPTTTDVVDPNPSVDCLPASGSVFPIGSSTVTCTATDATGNQASDSFPVTVTFVPPVAWSAAWGEPVSSPGDTFVANSGRTIPVKVTIFADGVEQTTGHGALSIAACGGGASLEVALGWDGGRWNGHLDTSRLGGPGCYIVGALLDGHEAGSFRLDLRGNETAATQKGANK